MKCPRCGHEMVMDGHRKIDLFMCYDCGYIEGRNVGTKTVSRRVTNYERLHGMNMNEVMAFMSSGLGVDQSKLGNWLTGRIA